MTLSDKGLQLILDWEVGGGKVYYNRFCKRPVVPDPENTQSGVTIGIGWDCGYATEESLEQEWGDYLDASDIDRLKAVIGLRSMDAFQALPSLSDLEIEWESALDQFLKYTVPKYWYETCRAFPGVEDAPQCVQEPLLSLVFNRGASMEGDRRREMRDIRSSVASKDWFFIPNSLREMKRLWVKVPGLQNRREAEAKFIENNCDQT